MNLFWEICCRQLCKINYVRNKALYGYRDRYLCLINEVYKIKPKKIMEIGTYKGNHSIEMIQASLSFHQPEDIHYFGFDLFEDMTSEILVKEAAKKAPSLIEVSEKIHKINQGINVDLFKGDTKITLPKHLQFLPKMDFIFIDGGHSFETVQNDWNYCKELMHSKTVVIFDDYVNRKTIKHENFGVNQLVDLISIENYKIKILNPVDWYVHDWGILKTRLVKVTYK